MRNNQHSDVIISAENLGKKYIIGHQQQERYTALRDVATKTIKGLVRSAKDMLHGRAIVTGDELEEFWALKDVNFEIRRGEVVGIIGRNGAGKSTLLKILSRITEPSEGKVTIKGRVASLLEVGTGFHPELTGRENIYLNGAILGMSRAEINRKFNEIVDFAEVEKFLDTPVKRYSSGMYVRLAFAVAAHLEPEILVVDEVLAVGDIQFQKKCLGKMDNIAKEGRTVLFVSHNMGAIKSLCQKCILLQGGKVQSFSLVDEVIRQYQSAKDKKDKISVSNDMRNKGNGSILFKSCSIFTTDHQPSNSFLIGQDVSINIDMEIKYSGKCYFWIIVFNSEGRAILSSHQGDTEILNILPGSYQLRYTTTNIGLMPGSYTVSAGAFDDTRTFLEWIDNCQTFDVLPAFDNGKSFDHRWGDVNQKATWALV